MPFFSIDTRELQQYAAGLMSLGRSAAPVAIAQTLNSAAFDVKQRTMPAESARDFTHRNKNFFRAASTVEKAKGLDVEKMSATVGFDASKANASKQAVSDLTQQESGGSISGRSFMPLDGARASGDIKKAVRPNARLQQLKFIDARSAKGKSYKQKFVAAAMTAGVGGNVLGKDRAGKGIVWRIDALHIIKGPEGWHPEFKLTPIYSYKKGRSTKDIAATHFMETASEASAQRMPVFFEKHARTKFEQHLKKHA
jgi:hypothetical protein